MSDGPAVQAYVAAVAISILIMFPAWFIFGNAFGVPLGLCFTGVALWKARQRVMARAKRWQGLRGQCLQCGYDLRSSTGRCPECGDIVV